MARVTHKILMRLAAAALALCLAGFGCATSAGPDASPDKPKGGLGSQRYIGQYASYTTGPLPAGWTRLWGYDGDLAFYNSSNRATVMVNSTCPTRKSVPLVALRNHLLFDLTERQFILQEDQELDLRMGLHSIVQGRLDGALVKLDIYVVQIDECVFDLVMISGLEHYETCRAEFEEFVKGFHVKRKG